MWAVIFFTISHAIFYFRRCFLVGTWLTWLDAGNKPGIRAIRATFRFIKVSVIN
jgi:hypothetical protein